MWRDVMDGFWRPFKETTDGLLDVAGRDVITELDQRLSNLLYKQEVSSHSLPYEMCRHYQVTTKAHAKAFENPKLTCCWIIDEGSM